MKILKLKNYFLLGDPISPGQTRLPKDGIYSLPDWLLGVNLSGKESRYRSRFIKLIADRAKEISEERMKFAGEYAKKDKKGQSIYLDKDGKETTDKSQAQNFQIKDPKGFNETLQKYLEEDYVLDVTPETSEVIYAVKDILLETEEEFSGIMAMRYEEWCEAFEGIKKAKK